MASTNTKLRIATGSSGLLPDSLVAERYKVTTRTIDRWDREQNLEFPEAWLAPMPVLNGMLKPRTRFGGLAGHDGRRQINVQAGFGPGVSKSSTTRAGPSSFRPASGSIKTGRCRK